MAPVTDFAVKEKYTYFNGLSNYHESEAIPGASPLVNNSPQKPPYGLRTERISGTSFTAPRDQTLQTWMYRAVSSLDHSDFVPYEAAPPAPTNISPNAYMWLNFPAEKDATWLDQKLLGRNGEPIGKDGCAIWIFNMTADMPEKTVFSSLDGDCLIILHAGAMDIQTELGKLLVRQNEIAVIPRGTRYRITLPTGAARGTICELFQGHYQLPSLGAIGSTGLANVRDFQIPKAHFDGDVRDGRATPHNTGDWTIISRLSGRLWSCTPNHTPFDVAAWHGTSYPYKYDLARFCVMGNMLFDEHDPSLYVVLTVPTHAEPGTAVVDFAIVPPRWNVAEDTLWIPYYHRNTMSKFFGTIVNAQEEGRLGSFCVWVEWGGVVTHGAEEETFQKASNGELSPKKVQDDGFSIFLLETEKPLMLSDWAEGMRAKREGRGVESCDEAVVYHYSRHHVLMHVVSDIESSLIQRRNKLCQLPANSS
ncbi:Homogentisate 1,2-dioxygenase [Fulvia fulva]|nr:Homogentisate 1,2-dioxygenase [Fulvia fulva]